MNLPYRLRLPEDLRLASLWMIRYAMAAVCVASLAPQVSAQTAVGDASTGVAYGPIRLRQSAQANDEQRTSSRRSGEMPLAAAPRSTPLSDFELHVRKQPGAAPVRRFGLSLIDGLLPGSDAAHDNPLVPPDYVLRPGDELVVVIWGSVDAELRLQIDRSGRVTIPRVGPVMLSGVRFADVQDVVSRRVASVFRNFQLSVSLGQLRGQRVFVTGFVDKPGAVSVSSLATAVQALMLAGGPSSAGSFRNIELRRGSVLVARLDLYELLLSGNRAGDQTLQSDDVIHVGPIGPQVALIGAVNQPAIFEVRPGETIDDVLRMAGGFSAVADGRRITLERLDVNFAGRLTELAFPLTSKFPLVNGDLIRAFNIADIAGPSGQKRKRIRVEGEVAKPGEYVLPATSTLHDALQAAGGLTTNAYLYGTEFARESVRATQQQNYERALRDFETQITAAAATRRTNNAEEANALTSASAANSRLIEQLRMLKPTGRVVLNLTPLSQELPELMLEDGDRLSIPARSTTVGVFGSVFSTGSYLYTTGRTVGDYLRLAGGPTRGGDDSSVFVIRANGSVVSSLQASSWLSRGNQIAGLVAEPGDTVFVPEEMNKTTWMQNAKDWTQILYQFGIGIAGIKSATQ